MKNINKIICLGMIAILMVSCFVVFGNNTTADQPIKQQMPLERKEMKTWDYYNNLPQMFSGFTDDSTYSFITTSGGFDRITKSNDTRYHKTTGNNPCSICNDSTYVYYCWGTGQVARMPKTTATGNTYTITGAMNIRYMFTDSTYLWMVDVGNPGTPKIYRSSLIGTSQTSWAFPNSNMTTVYTWASIDSTYIWYMYKDNTPMPTLNVLGKMEKSSGTFTEYVLPYLDSASKFYIEDSKIYVAFEQDNFTYSNPWFGIFDKSGETWNYHYIPDYSGIEVRFTSCIKLDDYVYICGGNATGSGTQVIFYYQLSTGNNGTFKEIFSGSQSTNIWRDYNLNYAWFPLVNISDMDPDPAINTNKIAKIGIMFDNYGTIQDPTSSDIWYAGETETIQFTIINGSAPYTVWFNYTTDHMVYSSLSGITQGKTYATAGIKTETCTVPSGLNNETFSVAVAIFGEDMDYYVIDSDDFIITEYPSISLDSFPETGRNLEMAGTFQINYTISNGLSDYDVFINYTINGGSSWINIENQSITYPGLKCFNFTAPTLLNNTMCYIKLVILDDNNRGDIKTTDTFIISLPAGGGSPTTPDVSISYPTMGINYDGNQNGFINYTIADGSGFYWVMLNYSIDNNVSWDPIDSFIVIGADDYSYTWMVPNIDSSNTTINITVIDGNDLRDSIISDRFTITSEYIPPIPSLEVTITNPELNDDWYATLSYDINYTIADGSGFYWVMLNYSIDNNVSWDPIDSFVVIGADDYSYTWMVPETPSLYASINITVIDGNTTHESDISDNFQILNAPIEPAIIINYPGEGNYIINEPILINFTIIGGSPTYYVWFNVTHDAITNPLGLAPTSNPDQPILCSPAPYPLEYTIAGDKSYNWAHPGIEFGYDLGVYYIEATVMDGNNTYDYYFTDDLTFESSLDITINSPGEVSYVEGLPVEINYTISGGFADYGVWINVSYDGGSSFIDINNIPFSKNPGNQILTSPPIPYLYSINGNKSVLWYDAIVDTDIILNITCIDSLWDGIKEKYSILSDPFDYIEELDLTIYEPTSIVYYIDDSMEITFNFTGGLETENYTVYFNISFDDQGNYSEMNITDQTNPASYNATGNHTEYWVITDNESELCFIQITVIDGNGYSVSAVSDQFEIATFIPPIIPPTTQNGITITFIQIGNWNTGDESTATAYVNDVIFIKVLITCKSNIDTVEITYDVPGEETNGTESMDLDSGTLKDGYWIGSIPAQDTEKQIEFFITAISVQNKQAITDYVVISVVASPSPGLNVDTITHILTSFWFYLGIAMLFLIGIGLWFFMKSKFLGLLIIIIGSAGALYIFYMFLQYIGYV